VTFSHRLSTYRHTVPEQRAKYILPAVIITQTITVATATYPTITFEPEDEPDSSRVDRRG